MNIAIYARFSSESQREESIDGQIRDCKEYAERNGMTVVEIYVDRACSASKDIKKRKDFLRMISDSYYGKFEAVLVWKLDRFARNRYDSALYRKTLEDNNVQVISVTEQISDDPQGIILQSVLEGMAQYYSEELSLKVRRGQRENALKCKHNGGWTPFGYRVGADKQYEIDEQNAQYVREIFRRYADGDALKEIADDLNARCIKPEHGKEFRFSTLNVMLHNKKYIGEYSYGETVIPDGVPSIVDMETFERCQKRLEENKRKPGAAKADEPYILTSKVFCGDCGSRMFGESGCGRTGKIRYYRCYSAKRKHGCKMKSIRKEKLEDLVVREAFSLVKNRALMERVAKRILELQQAENYDLITLRQQLKENGRKIENLMNAIMNGVFCETTKQYLEELEKEKAELESRIEAETQAHQPLTYEQILFFLCQFSELDIKDIKDRKKLVDSFVNSVYVYRDNVVLNFNYRYGSKTVSFSEIKDSDLEKSSPPDEAAKAIRTPMCWNALAALLFSSDTDLEIPKIPAESHEAQNLEPPYPIIPIMCFPLPQSLLLSAPVSCNEGFYEAVFCRKKSYNYPLVLVLGLLWG